MNYLQGRRWKLPKVLMRTAVGVYSRISQDTWFEVSGKAFSEAVLKLSQVSLLLLHIVRARTLFGDL